MSLGLWRPFHSPHDRSMYAFASSWLGGIRMSSNDHSYHAARAAEKAAARQRDMDDLAAGRVTRADLARRNNFTAVLDLSRARIIRHPKKVDI